MTKLDTEGMKLAGFARKETAIEKTTRAAWEILEDENEQRRSKMERLRKSRLQYERGTQPAKEPQDE